MRLCRLIENVSKKIDASFFWVKLCLYGIISYRTVFFTLTTVILSNVMAINIQVPKLVGDFLIRWTAISYLTNLPFKDYYWTQLTGISSNIKFKIHTCWALSVSWKIFYSICTEINKAYVLTCEPCSMTVVLCTRLLSLWHWSLHILFISFFLLRQLFIVRTNTFHAFHIHYILSSNSLNCRKGNKVPECYF